MNNIRFFSVIANTFLHLSHRFRRQFFFGTLFTSLTLHLRLLVFVIACRRNESCQIISSDYFRWALFIRLLYLLGRKPLGISDLPPLNFFQTGCQTALEMEFILRYHFRWLTHKQKLHQTRRTKDQDHTYCII